MLALFRQRRVVDDQPRVAAANHLVGRSKQGLLNWRCVPHAACDEVMKLVVTDLTVARRHGLNALAVAPADQPRNIDRAHPRARLVPQSAHERREPSIKIGLPGFFHGRPSAMPTTQNRAKRVSGILKMPKAR